MIKKNHSYNTHINYDLFCDLQRIKELDGRSINSLLNEGAKFVRDMKMQEIAVNKRQSNSLKNHVGW